MVNGLNIHYLEGGKGDSLVLIHGFGGNSMGGYIAGQYAALFPGDLKSLFLIAPAGVLSSEFSQMQQRIKNGGPNPLIAKNAGEFDELLEFIFVKKPFIPGPIKNYLKDEALRHQVLNETIFQLIKDTDLNEPMESLLGHLDVNAFILWGADDKVLHPSGARILEAIIKNSKALVLKNVGHVPMIELPKKTAGLYLEFHNMK